MPNSKRYNSYPVYQWSDDGGVSWSGRVMLVDTVSVKETHATRPVLWAGTVYVVWQDDSEPAGDVWVSAFRDGAFHVVGRILEAQWRNSLIDFIVTPQGLCRFS
jgi:hypothetical protein